MPSQEVDARGSSLPGQRDTHELSYAQKLGMSNEIARCYPQLHVPKLHFLRHLSFYPGFLLVRIDACIDGEDASVTAVADPQRMQIFVIDAQGLVLDRLDAYVPLSIAHEHDAREYLSLRLRFANERVGASAFALGDSEVTSIAAAPDGDGFDASVRLLRWQQAGLLRSTTATLRIVSVHGIVSARSQGPWAVNGDEAGMHKQTPLLHERSVTRIVTPYFVEEWHETWHAHANIHGAQGAPEAIGEPHASLIRGFRIDADNLGRTVIRSMKLPFYRTFKLFEVAILGIPGTDIAEVGYCLGRPSPREVGEWEFHWLNGTSSPVHAANAATMGDTTEIDLHEDGLSPDEVGSRVDHVSEYVRFFCWAVEGDEGPFFAPRRLERLELSSFPPKALIEHLEALDAMECMGRPLPGESGTEEPVRTFLRVAVIFYGGQAFRATLHVAEPGDIWMPDDEPFLPDVRVPIDVSRMRAFGRRPWFERPIVDVESPHSFVLSDSSTTAPEPVHLVEPTGRLVIEDQVISSSSSVLNLLQGRSGAIFRRCTFSNGLAWSDGDTVGFLTFEECTFLPSGAASLMMTGLRVAGTLLFFDCHFHASIIARRLRVEGSLGFYACTIAKERPTASMRQVPRFSLSGSRSFQSASGFMPSDDVGVDLADVVVAGRLAVSTLGLVRTIVAGALSLPRARVGGDLVFDGLWCGGAIDVTEAKVEKGCIFGGSDEERVKLDVQTISASELCAGWLFVGSARLGEEAEQIAGSGHLQCEACQVDLVIFRRVAIGGDVSLFGARVARGITFDETRILGSLSLHFAQVGHLVYAASRGESELMGFHLHCRGDFELSGAEIGGMVLGAVRIEGTLNYFSGKMGCLYFYPAIVKSNQREALDVPHLRRVSIKNVEIPLEVRIFAARIGFLVGTKREPLFARISIWLDSFALPGMRIENSLIGGDLLSLPEGRTLLDELRLGHKELARLRPSVSDFLDGLELKDSSGRKTITRRIVGDLVLRGNTFAGSIELRAISVFGRLVLADTDIGIDLNLGATRSVAHSAESGLATICTEADLEKLVCGGDIDLTGLCIARTVESGQAGEVAFVDSAFGTGDLKLRDAEVRGDLLLVEEEDFTRSARIEGVANLAVVRANKLALTRSNLPSVASGEVRASQLSSGARGVRVVLERARLSQLAVVRPVPESMDLTAIQVARWTLTRRLTEAASVAPTGASDYVEILEAMNPFDRGVWAAVESELRNHAREDDANDVYRAMRRQARRHLSMRRKVFDVVSAVTLAYGTRPWLPLLPLLAAFVLLAALFTDPSNVVPSADLLQAQGASCETLFNESRTRLEPRAFARLANVGPPCERLTPTSLAYTWDWTDGTYLSLRHSVPVVSLLTHGYWQAAHRPVVAPEWMSPTVRVQAGTPGAGSEVGLRADTLAAFVSLYAWVAVPISLLFFGSRVFRGQRH